MGRHTTEIIIVKYNFPEVEIPCITSVLECTANYHLTIYDNYPENYNLGLIWNGLIKRSDAEFICLLNSDTKVTPGWLAGLKAVYDNEPNVGVVGPVTDNAKNHQKQMVAKKYYALDFSQFYYPEVLSGFCLFFPKHAWEIAGGFPEDYGFYGQEVAFIDKLLETNFRQYLAKHVFVHHRGSATVKREESLGHFNELEERKEARRRRENQNL